MSQSPIQRVLVVQSQVASGASGAIAAVLGSCNSNVPGADEPAWAPEQHTLESGLRQCQELMDSSKYTRAFRSTELAVCGSSLFYTEFEQNPRALCYHW